jgi:hypothetical protein
MDGATLIKYFPARKSTEPLISAFCLIALGLLFVLPAEVILAASDLVKTPHSEPCFFCGCTRSLLAFREMEFEHAYILHAPLFISMLTLTAFAIWRSFTFLYLRRRRS